jgi:hypothetical protein
MTMPESPTRTAILSPTTASVILSVAKDLTDSPGGSWISETALQGGEILQSLALLQDDKGAAGARDDRAWRAQDDNGVAGAQDDDGWRARDDKHVGARFSSVAGRA